MSKSKPRQRSAAPAITAEQPATSPPAEQTNARGDQLPTTRKRRKRETLPDVYTRDHICRLISACHHATYAGRRMRALLILYWRTGLRSQEALDLYPKDVDLDRCLIRLVGKGGKLRTVGMDVQTADEIRKWLEFREIAYGFGPQQPLFSTRKGTKLTTPSLRRKIKALAKSAGITDVNVHLHGLRHSFAVESVEEGISVAALQRQLGHSSLTVTDIYLQRLNPKTAIQSFQARTW